MANKTNCKKGNQKYFRIKRKVGEKIDKNGKWVTEYKDFYGKSKSEAEKKYLQYIEKFQTPDTIDASEPIAKLIDEWIETTFKYNELADTTKVLYETNYRRYFRNSYVGKMPLENVTPRTIQDFYNKCDIKFSCLRSIDKLLKHFYRYCELTGVHKDFTRVLKVPKKELTGVFVDSNDIEVWEDEDLKKLIKALFGTKYRFLIVLAVNSGARISELLALNYSDIANNTVTISKQVTSVRYHEKKGSRLTTTKTQSSMRSIKLSNAVMKEFELHKKVHEAEMMREKYTTDYIFSSTTGNYMDGSKIRKTLNKVCAAIGIQHHEFHSFRKTFGSNLSRAGVPIERTSKMMGHSDLTTTSKYYLHIGNKEELEAVESISGYTLEDEPIDISED